MSKYILLPRTPTSIMKTVAIIFAALFAVSYAAPPCDDLTIASCAFKVGEGFDPKDPRVPESDFEMDKRCRNVMPVLECLEDALTRCPPKDMTKEYLQFIKDQTHVEKHLCEKGDELRERLLKHSKCLNGQLSELEEKCGNAIEIHSNILIGKDCKPHYKYRKCYVDITKKNCGDDGVKVVKDGAYAVLNFFDSFCEN